MMQNFQFITTEIHGLIKIFPFIANDNRGHFTKDYSKEIFAKNNIHHELEEIFYTTNHRGVIRGLRFQCERPQPKLVRCIVGRVFDVAVDLRKDSPTFGKWLGYELSAANAREVLIPAGCAHGYLVLEESVVSYKCAERFYPEYDDGIIWNDPDIGIKWPIDEIGCIDNIIIADKDTKLLSFKDFKAKYSTL